MMKQLITESNDQYVLPDKLKGNEFVAYVASNKHKETVKSSYCVLTKLDEGKYGFINLFYTGTTPSFVGTSFLDCATKASKKRKVCVFDSAHDMLAAIINETF